MNYLGNCKDENLIEALFWDISNFARLVEEKGDNFTIGDICVKYDDSTDTHSFYSIN